MRFKFPTVILMTVLIQPLVSCSPEQRSSTQPPLQSFSSVGCLEFRTELPVRSNIIEFFNDLAKQYQGKVLVETQRVYFKVQSPEYYILYDDRMQAYGNLIQSYSSDVAGVEIDNQLRDYIYGNFVNVGNCTGSRKSSISSFDF